MHCQAWWQSKQPHQEMLQQGKELLQNAKQCKKVIPVQYQEQAKTVLELHTFHPTVQLRMLEDDWEQPKQTVHLLHQEP